MAIFYDGIFTVDTDDVATNVGLLNKGVASIDTSKTSGTNINGIYSTRLDRYLTINTTPSDATVVVTLGEDTISPTNGKYTLCLGRTYTINVSKDTYTTQEFSYQCLGDKTLTITLVLAGG